METDAAVGEVSDAGPRAPAPPRLRVLKEIAALKPVQVAAAFIVILAAMTWIEFSGPAILDVDGFYHIRWSKMLRESFPELPAFKALPLTVLNEQDYVDHHYLFHVMLFPFTFGDLRIGAKVAAAVFSSLAILSLFALLVAYKVRYRWLWLLPMIACSEPFLYRMSMTRAPALSLAMLGLGAYLILKRKHVWLGALSFAFVWYYSLFPLIFIFAAAYTVSLYLAERKIYLAPMVASATGIILGLFINPYVPKNLALLWQHVLMKINTTSDYTVGVGVEWYPYDSWIMLASSAVAFAAYFAGLLAFNFRDRKRDIKPLFFLIISFVLLLMYFKSRRFVEYWPPFAVLFAAFTISPRLERINFAWLARTRDQVIAAVAAATGVVIAAAAVVIMLASARIDVGFEQSPYAYKGAGEWIASNTPKGSMIFNTDWDDFPMLFYFSPDNTYIAGLDPTYLYDRDRELWDVYVDITLGRVTNPAPIIRERFNSEYVFTDNDYHQDFLNVARRSGNFEIVYEDSFATVLKVLSSEERDAKRGIAQ
jgi:hypothetical protein